LEWFVEVVRNVVLIVCQSVCILLCFRYSLKEMMHTIRYKVDVNARLSQIMIAVLLNVKVECVSIFSKICGSVLFFIFIF
jgi:hypothetical protein